MYVCGSVHFHVHDMMFSYTYSVIYDVHVNSYTIKRKNSDMSNDTDVSIVKVFRSIDSTCCLSWRVYQTASHYFISIHCLNTYTRMG